MNEQTIIIFLLSEMDLVHLKKNKNSILHCFFAAENI